MRNEQKQQRGREQPLSLQPARPITNDPSLWGAYWQAQKQPWRTEPEISLERQEELEKCRSLVTDLGKGIYPFRGVKLSRADVEWLLATHDAGRGPVRWSDEQDREREGLDLRGADLRQLDLQNLPLTHLRGGLTDDERMMVPEEYRARAAVLLEESDLSGAYLEGACLSGAQLQGSDLHNTQLEWADLSRAQFKGADLSEAQFKGADLSGAQLEECDLSRSQLQDASLDGAQLQRADLSDAQLQGCVLSKAHLEGARLTSAQLQRAFLFQAHLEKAILIGAQLEKANLALARLEGADLRWAHLRETDLSHAHLEEADLRGVQLEGANLRRVFLGDKQRMGPRLADVHWDDTNLHEVNWSHVTVLGDEAVAHKEKATDGKKKGEKARLEEYWTAVRANRQLAAALQVRGLQEEAAHFAYRAQRLQRAVLRRQQKFGSYLFSWFLDLIAGYGYRPARSLLAYLVIIFGFMGLYLLNGHFVAPHMTWDEALVFSVSSFHGRGFFMQNVVLGDTYARLAGLEAVLGLFTEISLIATFTQRFLGK